MSLLAINAVSSAAADDEAVGELSLGFPVASGEPELAWSGLVAVASADVVWSAVLVAVVAFWFFKNGMRGLKVALWAPNRLAGLESAEANVGAVVVVVVELDGPDVERDLELKLLPKRARLAETVLGDAPDGDDSLAGAA